jgi:seryl-tRNA synthetase
MQELNTKRNLLTSDMLQQLKNKDTVRSNQIRSKVQQIKQEIDNIQTRLNEIGSHFNTILHSIPNIPHESVPKGINENDNIEISK